MFGSNPNGANAYANVGVETGVAAASPHKLIAMLFDGAIVSIAAALQHLKAGNVSAKGQAVSKAITIIESGLRASLDKKVGGEIADNLDSLYEYMSNRLLLANARNEPEMLEEVQRLLQELKSAWEAIDTSAGAAAQPAAQPPRASAYDPLEPHTSRLVKA